MNAIYLILSLLTLTLIILFIRCICYTNKDDKFEDTSKSIPKVIYLSHKKNIPDFVIQNWKKLNPDYTIKFYDDNMCRQFIIDNYPKSFIEYFDRLSKHKGSGPIKCDFWRVLILYKYGGVYADSDIELLVPIKNFLHSDTDFLTSNSAFYNSLNPHLIISRPGNLILEKCIDIYRNEKFNLKYSYWDHSIVFVMVSAFNNLKLKFNNNIEIINTNIENNNYKIQLLIEKNPKKTLLLNKISDYKCYYNNKPVLNNRYSNYNSAKHEYRKNDNILDKFIQIFI